MAEKLVRRWSLQRKLKRAKEDARIQAITLQRVETEGRYIEQLAKKPSCRIDLELGITGAKQWHH